jgi:glucokinase
VEQFAIAVDLGGTNLRVATVSDSGEILERISLATRREQGRDAVIGEMASAVRALSEKQPGGRQLAGIGIGVPGIIYRETGLLRKSPNLPGWENYPVRAEIERLVGSRVYLENDANLAALGEKWLGCGKKFDSLCMITLGTGVGGGLVFDGEIWHGFLGFGAELGHVVVAENGLSCPCGGQGCLETESSSTAVVRKAKEALTAKRTPALAEAIAGGAELTSKLVCDIARKGDAACVEIFRSQGRYLGIALAGFVNSLNLPLYVIGGGGAAAWDLFEPEMMEELSRRSYVFHEGSTRIEQSALGGGAGLCGAARLAFAAAESSG